MKYIVGFALLFCINDLVVAHWCGLPIDARNMPFLNWIPTWRPNIISAQRGHARIVNGVEAKEHSWPWQVGLGRKFSNGSHGWAHCGGSIITSHVIVTAAHCFNRSDFWLNGTTACVYLGAHSQADFTNCITASDVKHPRYNYTTDQYDLATLSFKESLPLNSWASPICIPDKPIHDISQAECYVTGWGDTAYHGTKSNKLRQTALSIQPQETCKGAYANNKITYEPQWDETNMICAYGQSPAGRPKEISDACQGDSGGPMVCRLNNGPFSLYGVVSWGGPCADKRYPGVYADVTKFRKEIEDVVAANGGWH